MSLPLAFRPEAELDIDDAFEQYRSVRLALADRFRAELLKALDLIQERPSLFAVVYRGIRRAPVHRFPYGIFYVVRQRHIAVLAVHHAARAPREWKRRR